jgi:hypothetical protein
MISSGITPWGDGVFRRGDPGGEVPASEGDGDAGGDVSRASTVLASESVVSAKFARDDVVEDTSAL